MTRRRLLPVAGLVGIAIATALAVVAVSYFGGADEPDALAPPSGEVVPGEPAPGSGLPENGIATVGVVEPRIVLFGDTISARVDVFLDRRKIDPATVRVSTEFLPWEIIGQQRRVRRDAGEDTYLRTTFALRCTGSPCLPANESSALEFTSAKVSYDAVGQARGARESLAVEFPILLVYSRFAAANLDGPAVASAIPFRADLDSFPAATYRVPPGLAVSILVGVAGLLAIVGAVLAFVAIPHRSLELEPEPEPEPEPVIVLTPLEQALELLEDASRADGAEDRRRALELVAEVLDVQHPDLARAARTLAWSKDDPLVEQTSGLATRVRTTIDTNGSGNGRVS